MAARLPTPVAVSQLRLRSITAGLGLPEIAESLTVITTHDREGTPLASIARWKDGAQERAVEVPVAHLLALARLENDHPERAPIRATPLHVPAFGGATFDPAKDEVRLNRTQTAVKDCLSDGVWRTIPELRDMIYRRHNVEATEAGVSARIRDLRKPQHGSHNVERRRAPEGDGLWQYRMREAE